MSEKKEVPQFSVKTEQGVEELQTYIANAIAAGTMVPKQGDVLNTVVKEVRGRQLVKIKYVQMLYEMYKDQVKGGTATWELVMKKLPPYFNSAEFQNPLLGSQKPKIN